MNTHPFESQLNLFEGQLALLSAALLSNDVHALVAAAGELQAMAVLFSKVLQPAAASLKNNPSARMRVKRLSATLGSMREALLRQSVRVDRALSALVPASQSHTYAPKTGVYARQPYGSVGRQSGEFRVLAA